MKMEFTAGEFLRVGSQLFWEQAGLENFVFRPAIYATGEFSSLKKACTPPLFTEGLPRIFISKGNVLWGDRI
jgi:hypothetical protein